MRQCGIGQWFPIPLLCLSVSSSTELQVIERQVIQSFQPRLNCPFILRKSVGTKVSETFMNGSVSNSKKRLLPRCSRVPVWACDLCLRVRTLASLDNAFVSSTAFGDFALMCRLTDRFSKAKQAAGWVKSLGSRDCTLHSRLLSLAFRSQGVWRVNLCAARLAFFCGSTAEAYHVVTVKYPQILEIDVRKLVLTYVRDYLRKNLSNMCTVKLRVLPEKATSILDAVDNTRVWCKSLHLSSFPCSCKALSAKFGPGENILPDQHYCIRFRNSSLSHFTPSNCSVRTVISTGGFGL